MANRSTIDPTSYAGAISVERTLYITARELAEGIADRVCILSEKDKEGRAIFKSPTEFQSKAKGILEGFVESVVRELIRLTPREGQDE